MKEKIEKIKITGINFSVSKKIQKRKNSKKFIFPEKQEPAKLENLQNKNETF